MALTEANDGYGLLVGDSRKSGQPQYYYGERGLVTIAAPRSGKTQCHIIPNLLTWRGPAIVLDVTGELWQRTSKQRSKYGPVYRIDPDHPGESDSYNPFDFVRSDPDHVWQDAVSLADLVFTKQANQGGDGGFFDMSSPEYIAVLACFIALKEPPWRRNFQTMSRYIAEAPLDGIMAAAKEYIDLPGLHDSVTTIKNSDDRTKANVVWTAKNCVGAWADPATRKISRVSDWHPRQVRANNATVYICLSLERIRRPAYVRMLVGQHLQEMLRQKPGRDVVPVQFFLDETPQLQRLDVLTQAIEAGGNFKVRVWMIMQWRSQLEAAYGKDFARGMIGACGLQAYMNPSHTDGLAVDLSGQIGSFTHRFDQSQRPLVTPQDLAGEAFRDDVIAFDDGVYKRLRKHSVNTDPGLSGLTGASP